VLTLSTPPPLHYNDGCLDTVQRIDAGQLHLAGTFPDIEGNPIEGSVQVRWDGCGNEPRYVFVTAE
jgi:hypothetical protein